MDKIDQFIADLETRIIANKPIGLSLSLPFAQELVNALKEKRCSCPREDAPSITVGQTPDPIQFPAMANQLAPEKAGE